MTFNDDLQKFKGKIETQSNDIFLGVGEECLRSIVEGSEITGAPGQQVDTGALKGSWQRSFPSAIEQVIGTDSPYAQQEEDGIAYSGKPITQHSSVGGPHSTELTIAGFQAIVEVVTKRVVGE